MSVPSCPSLELLRDCAIGNLPDREADEVLDHLDTCTKCEQFFSAIRVPDAIRSFNEQDDFRREPECSRLVDLLSGDSPSLPLDRTDQDLSGSQIRDYQLIRQLGRGGMGTVYLARHKRLNKLVAIKLVPEHSHEDPTAVARFEREMQAVGLLDHRNVVGALDAGDTDGMYFLTMELIDGIDLSRLTRGKKQLSIPDVCEIACQVANGMQYAHDQGLIHRDIKPSNLMLAREPEGISVKILDLGLATMPETSDSVTSLTDQQFLLGTLEYMAPEQCDSPKDLDYRADIYSLGVTLYRLLTGSVPFSGPDYRKPARRLFALTNLDAPRISTHRNDLPEPLKQLVDSMLARDPAARPQSMKDVAAILSQFSEGADLAELLVPLPALDGNDEQTVRSDSSQASPSLVDTSPTAARTAIQWKAESNSTDQRSAVSKVSDHSGRRRTGLVALAAAIPAILLASVFWITTDVGRIRVESADGIELTLEVLRDGEPIEGFQVTQTQQETTFGTGLYVFRLPRGTDDSIRIRDHSFYLKRNGRKVVKIERIPDAQQPPLDVAGTAASTNPLGWHWNEPVHLGKEINSEWKDDQPTMSTDGLTMIFGSYCTPRFSGEGDRDLWITTRDDVNSPWKDVANIGSVINSSMKEMHPSLHSESDFLAFASNRGGGVGDVDLWYSIRDPESEEWSRPINMGPKVNSANADSHPEISSDGLTLYFTSTRHGAAGKQDIWMCQRDTIDDPWKAAERLLKPINTAFIDSDPALSGDQLTLLFTSDRPGGFGGKDLWASTRSTAAAPWDAPFNLGPAINTPNDEAHAAFFPDGKSVVFSSTRDGGLGETDLWRAQRVAEAIAESTPADPFPVPKPQPEGAAPALPALPFDAAAAAQHQQAWANHWKVPVDFENSIGMKFRLIPPGEFLMGATKQEFDAAVEQISHRRPTSMNMAIEHDMIHSEHPQKRVRITQPFYLASTEVTEEQFDEIVGRVNPPFNIQGPQHAVGLISWTRAALFCNKLSRREGLPERYEVQGRGAKILPTTGGYRLPTEAEWEFSCRAGAITPYPFGDDPALLERYAWSQMLPKTPGKKLLSNEVRQKKPNAFGLYDLLGNCWEWCEDSSQAPLVTAELLVDPLIDDGHQQKYRMARGGFSSSCLLYTSPSPRD